MAQCFPSPLNTPLRPRMSFFSLDIQGIAVEKIVFGLIHILGVYIFVRAGGPHKMVTRAALYSTWYRLFRDIHKVGVFRSGPEIKNKPAP